MMAIRRFFKPYGKGDLVVAMENTGRYNWHLLEVLEAFNFKVYMIFPLHLKKSMGITRGKNDKIDALRICNFIEKNQQETRLWNPCPQTIKKIKALLAERASG
jgi:transposase